MKLSKITAALIAAATAIIPFYADTVNAFTPVSVYAEDKAYTYSIPDWIPQSFDEAISFRNTYGATHVGNENESDLLCVVFEEPSYSTKNYSIKNTAALPAEYYHNVFVNESTDTAYEVLAYKNAWTSKPDFKMQLICDSEVQKEYTFTSIGTQVFETDIYSWLPDCAEEYRMYDITHFNVSVKDNYVVFLLPHNAGTAYDWTLKDKGEDCFELAAPVEVVELVPARRIARCCLTCVRGSQSYRQGPRSDISLPRCRPKISYGSCPRRTIGYLS